MSGATGPAAAQRLSPEVEAFVEDMVRKHQFERAFLQRTFARVRANSDILRAISAPLTALPWYEFRSRYVNEARLSGGVEFWAANAGALARARKTYGVPEEIIVATIGIETLYGRNTGSFRVIDALTTLAFHYPPRAAFFRGELEEYLLLARESEFAVLDAHGSYAGAMGIPQFMPSSYRRYAVDFSGDGRRDIWRNAADAVGSVANYYRAFGWREGEPAAIAADPGDNDIQDLLAAGIRPHLPVSEIRKLGVTPLRAVDNAAQAAFITAETEIGPAYWIALNNFYVITRYNRSVNYALAVLELADLLRALVRPGG